MTINPLVAPIGAHPNDPWAGIWLAEDVEAVRQGVANGSWIDTSLGTVGAGLDALAAASDPAGTLLQYGLSWLMEHIRPLTEALDWLTGDPAQIAAHAQTWRNVSGSLTGAAQDLNGGVAVDVAGWQGAASSAYRTWASHRQVVLGGLANAANTMASISEGVAYLTAGVRVMVRDAIATVVSRAIDYAGEAFFSFGLATPWVIEQVSTLVASWSARIGRWINALRESVGRLTVMMSRLGEIMDRLKLLLRDERTADAGDPMRPPKETPPTKIAAGQPIPRNPLDAVPATATVRQLRPDPEGGAQYGVEYQWKQGGQTVRLRVHGPDGTAPPGSNAANGVTFRIQFGGRFLGPDGTLYRRGVSNELSEYFDPAAANATHIPWPAGLPFPWGR